MAMGLKGRTKFWKKEDNLVLSGAEVQLNQKRFYIPMV